MYVAFLICDIYPVIYFVPILTWTGGLHILYNMFFLSMRHFFNTEINKNFNIKPTCTL